MIIIQAHLSDGWLETDGAAQLGAGWGSVVGCVSRLEFNGCKNDFF